MRGDETLQAVCLHEQFKICSPFERTIAREKVLQLLKIFAWTN